MLRTNIIKSIKWIILLLVLAYFGSKQLTTNKNHNDLIQNHVYNTFDYVYEKSQHYFDYQLQKKSQVSNRVVKLNHAYSNRADFQSGNLRFLLDSIKFVNKKADKKRDIVKDSVYSFLKFEINTSVASFCLADMSLKIPVTKNLGIWAQGIIPGSRYQKENKLGISYEKSYDF